MGRGSSLDKGIPEMIKPFSAEAWQLIISDATREAISAATGLTYDSIYAARQGSITEPEWLSCENEDDAREKIRSNFAAQSLSEAFASNNKETARRNGAIFFAWQTGMREENLLSISGWDIKKLRDVIEREAVEEAEASYYHDLDV